MDNNEFYFSIEDDPPPVRTIGKEVLTFLHADEDGKIATKRFRGRDNQVVKTSAKCTYWTPELVAVTDLYGAYEALKVRAGDPGCMLVRGALIDPRGRHIRRKHKGSEATLVAHARYLNCIDVDSVDIPGLDYDDPEPAIRRWLSGVRKLRGADLTINLSASWGIKPGVRAKIFYWGDRPINDGEAKALAADLPFACDPALYTPSQPHYFADPIFDIASGACPQYFGERWFYFAVDEGSGELHIDAGTAADELKHWTERISELDGAEPRHRVINSAGYYLGRYVKAGAWTADALTETLIEACGSSGAFDDDRLKEAEDEIRRAIADGKNDTPEDMEDWRALLQRNDDRKLKSTIFNLLLILRFHPALKGLLRYNVRRESPEWASRPPWDVREGVRYPRQPTDADAIEAAGWLNGMGMGFTTTAIHGAFDAVARDADYDDCVDYLDGLAWDGVERVKHVYVLGAGAAKSEWAELMGMLLMDSLAHRIKNPGCKMDTMPILVHQKEGIGKSTFFRLLVGGIGTNDEYFSDNIGDYSSAQRFGESLAHYLIIEDGELAKLRSREIEHVKRALSSQKDVFRYAYARRVSHKLRRCVIVGSTNNEEFLDPTGANRRFPAITAGNVDRKWLIENRDQLFAEAAARYASGSKPWLDTSEMEMQFSENECFVAADPWEELTMRYLDGRDSGVDEFGATKRVTTSATQVLTEGLGIPAAQLDMVKRRRMGVILRRLGWIRKTVREEGNVVDRFVRPSDYPSRLSPQI